MSNATDCAATCAPSVAVTYETYRPRGSIVPSDRRPSNVQVWVPAGRSTPDRCVSTVWPAASRSVQLTVIGRASTNDSVVVRASASRSCGKKIDFDVATDRRAPMRSTVRSSARPAFPASEPMARER